ncbi:MULTISPECIES: PilZ domain-containing protein [Kistimonas]|uniref:PilZ domain-containing protein n=1 Tax=Kistimonas scapharcae TaxID=1036133 RepID=A0ABP8VA24_9GAMM|nr:PilZ domain-containing protein [Kistimonas asteriae]
MARKAISENSHRICSERLAEYLVVYNRCNDMQIGYIGNISRNGLMLITPWMMELGGVYSMRIQLPEPLGGYTVIDFDARCQWCHRDITPDCYDSGYTIIERSEGFEQLVKALQFYFSFQT